ncbi:MAG: DUF6773 family protein [Oscillospiraceae bacterium]
MNISETIKETLQIVLYGAEDSPSEPTEKDERILMEKLKLRSRAYSILTAALIGDITVHLISGTPRSQYLMEALLVLGVWLYVTARSTIIGSKITSVSRVICTSLAMGLGFALAMVVLAGYGLQLAVKSFFLATALYMIPWLLARYFQHRRLAKIDRQLDSEDIAPK